MQFGLLNFLLLKSIPPVMPSAWQRQSDAAALRMSRVCDYTAHTFLIEHIHYSTWWPAVIKCGLQYTFFLRQLIYHSAAAPPLK